MRTRKEIRVVKRVADEANPKDKYGLQKVPILSCVPSSALIYLGLAQRDGCRKYGPYNWREKPIRVSIFLDATMRHLLAWQDREELADDSGVPHLAHALACIAIIVDAIAYGNAIDDRPPAGPAARLLDAWKLGVPWIHAPSQEEKIATSEIADLVGKLERLKEEDAASRVVRRRGVSRRRVVGSRRSVAKDRGRRRGK